ncbi:MAG: helix-turn-helix domain-containing protein [Bdellovibrionaceae bacterium]|nr:helix-turn-helix domain-containing protein [Pseudobdellovibrionaceae bacterium]
MLSDALKYLRKFNGVSLTQLSNELKISVSYLSEIENGKKKPNLDIIEKYAERFKVRKSAILFFAEEINEQTYGNQFFKKNIIKFMKIMDAFNDTDDETL